MKVAATLLLVMLSNEGYWFGGRNETIHVQWAVKEPAAATTITWQLVYADARLTAGQIVLPAQDRTGKIEVTLPEVRVPTDNRTVAHRA
jgi:hypothetical protein